MVTITPQAEEKLREAIESSGGLVRVGVVRGPHG